MTVRSLVAIAIFAVSIAAGAASQQTVFRSVVDTVVVDVSVYANRRPVDGLTAADFEVLDNSVPQTVLEANYESVPIDVTMLLDVSGSVQGRVLETLTRAAADVGRRLRPADRATLVIFNDRIREVLRDEPGDRLVAMAAAGIPAGGNTSLYDALAFSLVSERPPGRRQMLIAFTDGRDTMSVLDPRVVMDAARRADMAMFFVTLSPSSLPEALRRSPMLEQLATLTGGVAHVLTGNDDLSASFLRAFDDFRASYVVRYTATGVTRPGWHEISVRVKRPSNATVRARKGYFGGS